MRTIFTFIATVSISLTAFALMPDDYGCKEAQRERNEKIETLQLSDSQKSEVYSQCRNSNSWYWFSTQLYLSARDAGDSHESAMNEYYLFKGVNYTIANYEMMRAMTAGQNLSTEGRRAMLQSLISN